MKRLGLIAVFSALLAVPAQAGGFGFDLPHLVFPPQGTTLSTAGAAADGGQGR